MELALLTTVSLLAALALWHVFTTIQHRAEARHEDPEIVAHLREVEHVLSQIREDFRQNEAVQNRRLREAREHIQIAADLVNNTRIQRHLQDIDQLLEDSLHQDRREETMLSLGTDTDADTIEEEN
jgi:uncharacterized membrane protein YhiD involved in acid resistance